MMNTYREESAADGKAESESEREEGDGGRAHVSTYLYGHHKLEQITRPIYQKAT